jgi:hypothetical protein
MRRISLIVKGAIIYTLGLAAPIAALGMIMKGSKRNE